MDSILDLPAMEPPPGVVPDFDNPGGNRAIGYGMIIAGSVLSTIAVLARLGSSAFARKFGLEDAMLVTALGIFAGMQYVAYDLTIYPGYLAHQWNVPVRNISHFLYYNHLGAIFYGPAIMCIKIAILVNWLRIFVPSGQRDSNWWTLQILIWTNIIFFVVATFTEIFRCWPRQKIWDPLFEGGSCPINVGVQNIAVSAINFISDTAILAMPQRIIWKLQMSRSRKWGLSLLFVIGIGAWAFGIVRTVYFVKLLNTEDVTYVMTGIATWTIWETTCGFLIMGIPALPKMAKAIPMSESIVSFFRSLSGHGDSGSEPNMPQYQLYQPKPRKRRGQWTISDLDTNNLISMRSMQGEGNATGNTAEQAPVSVLGKAEGRPNVQQQTV